MEQDSSTISDIATLFVGASWFNPIEAGIRAGVHAVIAELVERELEAALGRGGYERDMGEAMAYWNGMREPPLTGSFGTPRISVPRARLAAEGGGRQEW